MSMPRTLPALVLLVSAVGVSAQTMKPGLWEITNTIQSGGKELTAAMASIQKQMASMPPEQRKMMDDMMAKQGVKMGGGAGSGMTIKMCMTQEMVDRDHMATPHQGDCTNTIGARTGGSMKFSFKCTKPPASGQGEVSLSSPEAYSMKMSTTTSAGGTERTMEMQATGKWMGSNCGDIKPIAIPAK
jgi:hypothetical protein